jgi:hypothetical protein
MLAAHVAAVLAMAAAAHNEIFIDESLSWNSLSTATGRDYDLLPLFEAAVEQAKQGLSAYCYARCLQADCLKDALTRMQ